MDLSASVAVSNTNNSWVEDNMVSACHNCNSRFGYFNRKHHCRNCGNIFCYVCSNYQIAIPSFVSDRPEAEDYWNLSYYVSVFRSKEERVCKSCYESIKAKTHAFEQIQSIFLNPISVDHIQKLHSSQEIKKHYFDHLRNIQYYLPNHQYSDVDKKILKVNAPYFATHSKYLVGLIKSISWKDSDQTSVICSILNSNRSKDCLELFCTRTCQEQLSFDDSLNILFITHQDLPEPILSYLFQIIENTPNKIIRCHITSIADICSQNEREIVHRSFFNIISRSTKLLYHMYWFLMHERDRSPDNVDRFLMRYDPKMLSKLNREYQFFTGLIRNLDHPVEYLATRFVAPISLPYDPAWSLTEVDLNSIDIKDSYTKPVVISFTIKKGEETEGIKLLFKKESVMNDVIVLNLMTLMDILLKENIDNKFGVVVYPTIPLTRTSGMIEIVDNAETVHSITMNDRTILQHILQKNENKVIGDVLDRYMYGLVSYTLHSYFLGLGDRHLQNIMITDDGVIFHIDFGYILGSDAYPLTFTDIKLCSGMLDVIGGSDGIRRQQYLDLCAKGIVVLRKYFNIFYILLAKTNQTKKLDKFIMNRFQPRQSDKTVTNELLAIISHSNNAYAGYIRDFLHHHSQQRTVQNGLTYTLEAAYHLVTSLTRSG